MANLCREGSSGGGSLCGVVLSPSGRAEPQASHCIPAAPAPTQPPPHPSLTKGTLWLFVTVKTKHIYKILTTKKGGMHRTVSRLSVFRAHSIEVDSPVACLRSVLRILSMSWKGSEEWRESRGKGGGPLFQPFSLSGVGGCLSVARGERFCSERR